MSRLVSSLSYLDRDWERESNSFFSFFGVFTGTRLETVSDCFIVEMLLFFAWLCFALAFNGY